MKIVQNPILSWVAFCVLSGAVHADGLPCGEAEELPPRFQRAIGLYEKGWGGSDEALVEALELLEELLGSREESPLARAYYGSACIANARQVSDLRKRHWLKRGAAEVDAAVKAAPADVQIRLLRAVSLAVLPRLAGRADNVQADFDWLVARAAKDSSLLSDVCRQTIFYHAGSFAVRNRDVRALDWLERAAELRDEGEMDPARVERMRRLAREQLPRQDR